MPSSEHRLRMPSASHVSLMSCGGGSCLPHIAAPGQHRDIACNSMGSMVEGQPWQACPDVGEQRQDGHGRAISDDQIYAMLCYEMQWLSGWPMMAQRDREIEDSSTSSVVKGPPWPAGPDVGEQRQDGHGRTEELGLPHDPGHCLSVDGVHRKDERRQQPLRLLPVAGRIPGAASCIKVLQSDQ